MSKLAKNIINKSLIVFKIFLKKVLKLLLYHQILSFKATFILMLLLNYHSIKKQDSKKILIELISPSNFEVIFTL